MYFTLISFTLFIISVFCAFSELNSAEAGNYFREKALINLPYT